MLSYTIVNLLAEILSLQVHKENHTIDIKVSLPLMAS